MPDPLVVCPEPAKALSAREECALLRAALQRKPRSAPIRFQLAKLLNMLDSFEETIALLGSADDPPLDVAEMLALSHALLARDGPGDARLARDFARRAISFADGDQNRSAALAQSAKAALRMGDGPEAVMLLEQALRLDPLNSAACKRLANHWLRLERTEEVLALTDRLQSRGAVHSRLLATRTIALARLGRIGEARKLLNLEVFLHHQQLPVPTAWPDLDSFNSALAAELSAHPGRRDGRHGTASRATVRIDAPATGAAPAAAALMERIAESVQIHASNMKAVRHAWIAARPARALLSSWCVITEKSGFEDWHTHPQGWMSGTYYSEVPSDVVKGKGEAGCLAFGLPEGLAGSDASSAFGTQLVRPRPGLLVLFPSHAYHRTFPHGSGGRRICISFDLRPV